MDIKEIQSVLKEYIIALLSPEQDITEESTLTDMNVDSLGLVKLFVFIEKEFGVSLGDIDFSRESISTFGKISKLIFDNQKE